MWDPYVCEVDCWVGMWQHVRMNTDTTIGRNDTNGAVIDGLNVSPIDRDTQTETSR